MATLVLLRHAKAEPLSTSDAARRLAPRGLADAGAVRDWWCERGLAPDRVVVSTAARTRQTWELAGVGDAAPEYDERVYEAAVEDLREVIAETGPDVQVLVVVGHNPGIERLAWELDDSPEARAQTDPGMPTSGLAVFEVAGWDLTGAQLVELAAPRG